MKIRIAPLLVAAVACFAAQPAFAQDFPSKPITLIVPWPAGGSTDVSMRAMAESASKVLGQPIDARREYRLAINNFTAGGGDGYPKLSDHPGHVNTGFTDADVMRAFIAARSPIKAADFAPPPDVVRR